MYYTKKKIIFYVLIFFIFFSFTTQAKIFHLNEYHEYGPIPLQTQNPLFLLFLANPVEKTDVLHKSHFGFSLETTLSNLFEVNTPSSGDGVNLDMEILRTVFEARLGLGHKTEMGVKIPLVSYSGGFLDSFIQGYHNAFGFPNAGRETVDDNSFSYEVLKDGSSVFTGKSGFGFGDVVLFSKTKWVSEDSWYPSVSTRLSFKIPTGKASNGWGSGRVDMGASFLFQKSYKRLHSYTEAGVLVLGGHDELGDDLNSVLGSLTQSFEINVFEALSFVAQVSMTTPLFRDASVSELSQIPLDLVFGFTGERKLKNENKIFYKFGFSEDPLTTGPSVDFSVFANVGLKI